MNKFSKTLYSTHFNQECFANSNHQPESKEQYHHETHHLKNNIRFHNPKPLQSLIEKKIEIDSEMFFMGKSNEWQGKTAKDQKNILEKRKVSSTLHDGFLKKVSERPCSQKESRIKIIKNLSLNKKGEDVIQRPQTSKGLRSILEYRETLKKSSNEDEYEKERKREIQTSYGSLKRNTAKQIQLQTSIDPEFLSLFSR